MLQIVQVSVGQPVCIGQRRGRDVISSIRKQAVSGPTVEVTTEGLAGDEQADKRVIRGKRVHGGLLQAVYVYPYEHLALWSAELGLQLGPAAFGENLTVVGATEDKVRIGDEFACGGVRFRVTKPRRPCYKLPLHLGIDDVPQRMNANLRCGWYLEVVKTGILPVNGMLRLAATNIGQPTVAAMFAAKVRADPTIPDMPED